MSEAKPERKEASKSAPKLDREFVPLHRLLDCWLLSADYILYPENDLYHANLASFAALKDVYLLNNPRWRDMRDKVCVGVIKDDAKCGTSSVSMGVAVEYFQKHEDRNKVLILNCGTGGTKYGLFKRTPFITQEDKLEKAGNDGAISCLEFEGVGYKPRRYGMLLTLTPEQVAASLQSERNECEAKNLRNEEIDAIAFVTGSIRHYYFATTQEEEREKLDQRIDELFGRVDVKHVDGVLGPHGKQTFFLSQEREGELELLAVQKMHANLAEDEKISKHFVPVVSVGIGRGTSQWAMRGKIILHDAGMNNIDVLAKFGKNVCRQFRGLALEQFLNEVETLIKAEKTPVIALKSGCTLAFSNKNVPNGDELKLRFLKFAKANESQASSSQSPPPPAPVPKRLFLAQNGNPEVERVVWRKPLTTIDALCAYASVLLGVDANFIAIYHHNGARIKEIGDIAAEDVLFFSQGEAFNAPPGIPTTTDIKHTLKMIPLSWIPDRWLLGHDIDGEIDKLHAKVTHATMSTLKELWYFDTSEWNEVRNKVHVCFEEDLETYSKTEAIIEDLKNGISSLKDDQKEDKSINAEERLRQKVALEKKFREKFKKDNLVQSFEFFDDQDLRFCGVQGSHAEFSKDFIEAVRTNPEEFERFCLQVNASKFPFICLKKAAIPLYHRLAAKRTDSVKRNKIRDKLRSQFFQPLKEPAIPPARIRVFFCLNTEKDGSAYAASQNWTLSRVCAEAAQVLSPGQPGVFFTRVFNKWGFEILPSNALKPISMKDEDTLYFSRGEDFEEEESIPPVKCTVPAIPLFSLRKLSDIDVALGTIKVVFDLVLLVPREGVPKEVRRDGFLVKPIRATLNQEPFDLDNPTSVILTKNQSTFSHIVPDNAPVQGVKFYKWKCRPTLTIFLNSCDEELHEAIKDCPFDKHFLHFVVELKTIRTRAYKVCFDMHFMKKGCFVPDKEKVDYLPEFDVDWQSARVELASRVPTGIEKDRWTESLQEQKRLVCIGQTELMSGAPNVNDPKWLDDKTKPFPEHARCKCGFREYPPVDAQESQPTLEKTQSQFLRGVPETKYEDDSNLKVSRLESKGAGSEKDIPPEPSFSLFVACPKEVFLHTPTGLSAEDFKERKEILNSSAGAFSVLHYSVLIRRDPTLLTLLAVFPVYLLCALALAIVWQSTGFSDSVANIAAVLLALFAYSPVVRSRLPPSPSITVIDYFLNYSIVVCFVVLLTGVVQEGYRQTYEINEDNVDSNLIHGEPAKIFLARISLAASMVIMVAHIAVFCYFAYKLLEHYRLTRNQSGYVEALDEANEEAKEEKAIGQRRIMRTKAFKRPALLRMGTFQQPHLQLTRQERSIDD